MAALWGKQPMGAGMTPRTGLRDWAAALAALLAAATPATAAEPRAMARVRKLIARMSRAKKPSRSTGTLSNGRLEHAAELPDTRVFGYRILSPKRKTHFGADRMVFGLMVLGVRMRELCAEAGEFGVGDISAKNGGKLSPHINHQMGLDVDLGFYVTDAEGKPLGNRMAAFDSNGRSKDGRLRFDAKRNWWLVASMFENPYFGEVRFLLLADWLKKLLLDHARRRLTRLRDPRHVERQKELIRRAEALIRQPSSSPHDNHYHLSLKKPPGN